MIANVTSSSALAYEQQIPSDQEIEGFFDALIPEQLETRRVPGASVAAVQRGQLVFTRGYGIADVGAQRPVDAEDTLFHIGSTAKLFTWTAVMQLAEQGVLDLDAEVNDYLDIRIPSSFASPITLKHLMTHTAGFENRDFGWLAATPEAVLPLGAWLAGNIPARVRPPGELPGYSNYGAALAGYIVERRSGVPFQNYVEQRIIQPLGMTSTTVRQSVSPALAQRMARGYSLLNGQLHEEQLQPYQGIPAGTVRSTAPDIARFMLAHLQHGRLDHYQMLGESTALRMHETLFRVDPRVNGTAHGFIEMDRNGERIIGHMGSAAPAYYSVLVLFPERNLGFFVAYNSDAARPFTVGNETLAVFVDRFFPAQREPPTEQSRASADRINQYVGEYRRNNFGGSYTTVEKLGRLLSAATDRHLNNPGDGTLEIESRLSGSMRFAEIQPDFFRELEGRDAVVFRRDTSGRVAMAVFSGEPIYAFERVGIAESARFNGAMLAVSVGLFLSVLVAASSSLIRAGGKPRLAGIATASRLTAIGMAVINITFIVGLAFVLSDPGPLIGDFSRLRALLILPLVGAGLTVLMLCWTVQAWIRQSWSLTVRIHYSAVALGAAAVFWFEANWNLLGFRF